MSKKVLILMGSPRKQGNTELLCEEFARGAREAGHEVEMVLIRDKNINGCVACGACRSNGGTCVQQDDMQKIYPDLYSAQAVIFASPIYYFTMTAQIEAAFQRQYCIGKPPKATKIAMLLSSGSPGVYESAKAQLAAYCGFTEIENAGVFTANGEENKSEAKLAEIREFAAAL